MYSSFHFLSLSIQSTKLLSKTEEPLVKKTDNQHKLNDDDDNSCTPPSIFSASLRAGLFDANVNVLLTCSLPDLRSLFATHHDILEEEEEKEEGSEVEGRGSSEGENPSSEGESPSEEENPSDEDVQEDEEDDDLQQLVMTLQSFVEDASELKKDTSVIKVYTT